MKEKTEVTKHRGGGPLGLDKDDADAISHL